MLPKQNRLKNKRDFNGVFKHSRGYRDNFLLLKARKNDLAFSRFGIVVSKKVSKKAVVRNKIRRRLSGIIKKDLAKIKKGVDVVLVASPGLEKEKFEKLEEEMKRILKKAGILC